MPSSGRVPVRLVAQGILKAPGCASVVTMKSTSRFGLSEKSPTRIVVGGGAMGQALAARSVADGSSVVLVNRSASRVAHLEGRLGPDGKTVQTLSEALRAGADGEIVATLDSAASASSMLLGNADLVRDRSLVLAFFDAPEAVERLRASLLEAGARSVRVVAFVSTPEAIRAGRARFFIDGPLPSAVWATVGESFELDTPRGVVTLGLLAPSIYASLVALHAWGLGFTLRSGLPASAYFEAVRQIPQAANPRAAVAPQSERQRSEPEAFLRLLARAVTDSSERGLDVSVPTALSAALSSTQGSTAPIAVPVLQAGVPAAIVGAASAWVLQRAYAALTRVADARHFDALLDSLPTTRTLETFSAAYAFRWRPRLYVEPTIPLGLVANELAHVEGLFANDAPARGWFSALRKVFSQAVHRPGGSGTDDFLAVFETIVPRQWSAVKQQALDQTRAALHGARVDFFLSAGIPFVAGHRAGPYLADLDDDHVLMNLHCNGGVFNFGHRPAPLVQALTDATRTLDVGNHHLVSATRARVATRLLATMPSNIDACVFGTAGAESVDLAIRLARAHTRRRCVLTFEGSFFGTAGLGAHGGDARFVDWHGGRDPSFVTVPRFDLAAVRRALAEVDVALVLCETVQASSGMQLPPPGFYGALQSLCNESGALLGLDEVQGGWGRSGRMWAFEHFGVTPDLVILGKGMSGGVYPMSACCFARRYGGALERDPFLNQSTGGGSELGCAVTEKVLDLTTDTAFLPRVRELAALFTRRLEALRTRLGPAFPLRINQLGLLISVGFPDPRVGMLVTKACFDRGLLVVFAGLSPDFVQVLPPLTLTDAEAEWACDAFEAGVADTVAALTELRRMANSSPSVAEAPAATAPATTTLDQVLPHTCVTLPANLLDALSWHPGEPHPRARVVGSRTGLVGTVTMIALDGSNFAFKRLPRFGSLALAQAYGELVLEYVQRLRAAGISCVDSVLLVRSSSRRGWVVQPALREEWLLPAVLQVRNPGERAAILRNVLRKVAVTQALGMGLDAHLDNWALLPGDGLEPTLLDVTQPLLRDGNRRLRIAYGGVIPLFIERALSHEVTDDLFHVETTVTDMLVNLRRAPSLVAFEPELIRAAETVLGLQVDLAKVRSASTKYRVLRGAIDLLTSIMPGGSRPRGGA